MPPVDTALPFVSDPAPRVENVERIAVLRGGGLGDLLFALPGVEALAAAYPHATVTLLGMPGHRALLESRPGPVHEIEVLPVAEGVRPGEREDPLEVERFVERMRERRFDLGVQLHGGGRFSNPFLSRLGARVTIGLRTPDAATLDREVPYLYYQHEMLRALEVAGLVGAPPVMLEPRLAVVDAERTRGRELTGPGPVLAIHPGATDPRRRWPAERFVEIARRAMARGVRVVVVGDATDAEAAERIVAGAGGEGIHSLAGRSSLSELVGVLATADVLVANDSGPRHLAQAVGCPTVGVFWVGNAVNAAPLGRTRHRVHLSWTTRCPVCGRDVTQVGWTAPRCEHDPSFVDDVAVDDVWTDVAALLDVG